VPIPGVFLLPPKKEEQKMNAPGQEWSYGIRLGKRHEERGSQVILRGRSASETYHKEPLLQHHQRVQPHHQQGDHLMARAASSDY
jgi:hypothetical protein